MTRLVALAALLAGCAGSQLYEAGETLQRHKETVAGLCQGGVVDAGPEEAKRCQAAADAYNHAWEAYTKAYACIEEVPREVAEGLDRLREVLDRGGAVRDGEGRPAEAPEPVDPAPPAD